MLVGDVFQLKFVCRHTLAQNAINVRHYLVTALASPAPSITEVMENVVAIVGPLLKNCIASAWTFQGAKFRQVLPNPGVFFPTTVASGPGVLVGESLPPQVAGVISLRSTVARSKCRGRFYVPCPTEADSGSGTPLAPLRAAYTTLGAKLIEPVVTVGGAGGSVTIAPVLLSHQEGKPDAMYQIDRQVVRLNFGTQRRRSSINRPDANEFA